MSYATTDLSDAHPEAAVLEPLFLDFGGNIDFHGPAHTLKIHEDNTLVRAALAAVLPACLLARPDSVAPAASAAPVWGDPTGGGPRGDDPLGLYTACAVCEPAHCPGYAIGWSRPPKP